MGSWICRRVFRYPERREMITEQSNEVILTSPRIAPVVVNFGYLVIVNAGTYTRMASALGRGSERESFIAAFYRSYKTRIAVRLQS